MENVNETNQPEVQQEQKQAPKMRTVMVASPAHIGTVGVWHAAALAETCKIGITNGINIIPIYMSFDALVQRARNDLFKLAVDSDVDDIFFIDTDQDWAPADFFRMLSHDVDIVAAPIVKKNDIEQYNVKLTEFKVLDNGLVPVESVGTGFMRIRREAIQKIWDAATEYIEVGKDHGRMVFDVRIVNGALCSEDVVFCQNWRAQGGEIYIDPLINCGHSGEKRWVGNFYQWIKLITARR